MPGDKAVYVVEDDDAVREALSVSLELAGYKVEVFSAATEFLKRMSALDPGCLVLDLRMPEMGGIELLERLGESPVFFPTIVITGHGEIPVAVHAMKAGAIDFIEKPFPTATLTERVERAFTENADALQASVRVSRLSTRERQVLERLVAGNSNKIIARDLSLSPRSVETYRVRLMGKMTAKTLADLVRLAFGRRGDAPPILTAMSGNDRTFSYARSPLNYPTACPALYRTIEIALAATRRSPSPPLKFGKNGIEARDPGKGRDYAAGNSPEHHQPR